MLDTVEVKVGSKSWAIRPTFAALAAIERRMDCGIVEVARRLGSRNVKLTDIVIVLHAGIKDSGDNISFDDLGRFIVEDGWAQHLAEATEFIANAIKPGPEEEVSAGAVPADDTKSTG